MSESWNSAYSRYVAEGLCSAEAMQRADEWMALQGSEEFARLKAENDLYLRLREALHNLIISIKMLGGAIDPDRDQYELEAAIERAKKELEALERTNG